MKYSITQPIIEMKDQKVHISMRRERRVDRPPVTSISGGYITAPSLFLVIPH